MSRIASPVFNGAPTDNLETVDVYGEVDPGVKNRFTSQFTAFSQSLAERLSGGQQRLAQLSADLNEGRVSLEGAKSRLSDILRGSRTELANLSNDLISGAASAISGTELTGDSLKVMVDGIYQTIAAGDRTTAMGIMAMMRDVTGNDLFRAVDLGAEVGLLSMVLKEISHWGIPELVDAVLASASTDEARFQAVKFGSANIAQGGDIDAIERMIDQGGAKALLAQTPDFAQQLLRRYQFKRTDTAADHPARLTQLVKVLNALQPDWLYLPRGKGLVYNLEYLTHASGDARLLLSREAEYRTPVLIASHYPKQPARVILRAMYPMIAIVA